MIISSGILGVFIAGGISRGAYFISLAIIQSKQPKEDNEEPGKKMIKR